ncbi:MAG TPA: hypothetical protein VL201_01445 [Patescibacteria group bacterium]|nr:hypothetical protein [Patescibacteria group bacterium]
MKNRINSALIGLSMLAIMPVLAEENVGKSSVQTEALPTVHNDGPVKDLKKSFVKEHIQGAGQAIDSGIMSVPYYLGYGVSGIASGLKAVAKYTIGLPLRMAGWGIDGTFGEGTTQGIWNKTSTGLKGSLAVALTYGAYKGINRFAKWINISDIQEAFQNGGAKNDYDQVVPLKFKSQHTNIKEFCEALAKELKMRFEYTDLLSYVKNPLSEYKKVQLVCDKIDNLVEESTNQGAESICNLARKKSTGGLYGLGRYHILHGYCHDALVLYTNIKFALKELEKPTSKENSIEKALGAKSLEYKDILDKINSRNSKAIIK